MKTVVTVIACALAAGALAQEQPKSEQRPRPALNLRLDDATSAAPRVTFGPPSATQTKEDREKGLPEMGGKPNHAFDRTISSGTNGATSKGVVPSEMDPVNRQ